LNIHSALKPNGKLKYYVHIKIRKIICPDGKVYELYVIYIAE